MKLHRIKGSTLTLLLILLMLNVGSSSCKKCITCTARDAQTNDIMFEESSCAQGPLQDEWMNGIRTAYPEPGYNTVCK